MRRLRETGRSSELPPQAKAAPDDDIVREQKIRIQIISNNETI